MTWVTGIASYFIIWWLVLFMVLPFGIEIPEVVRPGIAPSAPQHPRLLIKMVVTSLIAALIWVIVYMVIVSGVITLRVSPDDHVYGDGGVVLRVLV